MSSTANPIVSVSSPRSILDKKLEKSSAGRWGILGFILLLLIGVIYIARHLTSDLNLVHSPSVFPYVLLGVALLIALGFEFVNGFHDTANAVATVIYTHSLEPHIAVIYSGIMNFVGVLLSSGLVAYSIVNLLPVELILKVNFAMVFALLTAAILWNLVTWYKGLPASSSHTMIGSVIGVGMAYQIIRGRSGISGIDVDQVKKVFTALLVSPLVGFSCAFLVFLLFKLLAKDKRLYQAPEGTAPPPLYIRALLILTCGGVSYAHGSNDGQKGMGLIMLILVGTVPTAYALNHTIDKGSATSFAVSSTQVAGALRHYEDPSITLGESEPELEKFIATKKYEPQVLKALDEMVSDVRSEALGFGSLGNVPADKQNNVRNQMYLVSAALGILSKADGAPKMSDDDAKVLKNYKTFLDKSTKYIPTWVKVAVALALGLGTMVGWKRIVITVGEKIGKTHLTYAQGAAAEITAMCTILAADNMGLPVSTTHVVSSGIAGTMTANGSGLQKSTIRNILMAWFFTLPASALLSGCLFLLFHKIAG